MGQPSQRPRRIAAPLGPALCAALAATLAACGTGSSEEITAAPAASFATIDTASGPYGIYGLPGPWSREGASRVDFERETGVCRERSRNARRAAGVEDRSDAAYRTFLECMTERDWTRGSLPRKPQQVSRAALDGAVLP